MDILFLLKEFYDINNFYSININIKLKICSFGRLNKECLV